MGRREPDMTMFDIQKKTIQWGRQQLTLETGRLARQAAGAVLATYGETSVLACVTAARDPKPGIDFFPLTVNYQEMTFAAGKISRRLFQARRAPDREGDAGFAPHRPPDPSLVHPRLQERDAGRRHRSQP